MMLHFISCHSLFGNTSFEAGKQIRSIQNQILFIRHLRKTHIYATFISFHLLYDVIMFEEGKHMELYVY